MIMAGTIVIWAFNSDAIHSTSFSMFANKKRTLYGNRGSTTLH